MSTNNFYRKNYQKKSYFKKYYKIHNEVSDDEIALTAGSSEIAYRHGMKIRMVKGSERNLKITTVEDLETFETILKGVN